MQFERFYSLNESVVGSFHTYIIYDFSKLSQILGNLCGGNGVSVLPYAHPQLFKVFNTLYMYDIDVGCSLKDPTASTIA